MKVLLSLIQSAFEWTCKNSLQVALLVGLVVLVQTVLARWLTPRLRYALSLLILLRLLLPAVPSSPLSLENLFRPVARLEAHSLAPERGRLGDATLPEAALPDAPVTPIVAEPAPVAPATSLPVVTPSVVAPPSRLPALSVAEMLGLAWGCGLLALVSLAVWRYTQWCRLIRQGRRLADPRLLALLDGARQAMGVRRPVTLVAMARLGSPAVFGFRRVRLLLPETMLDQLTDQDLRLLFLHEMAHVRRHDMLLNVLLMAVQFVHWFNPLLWLGLHRLRADRELVCDAMVLQRTRPEERSGYGLLLLKLLTDFPADQAIIPTAVPVVSSQRELKRRIVLIKHHRSASRGVYVVTVMAAVVVACLTFTGSSQQPPVVPESAPLPAPAGQDPCATVRYASDHNQAFWITNNTVKTVSIRLLKIEIKKGNEWKAFSEPTEPGPGLLYFRHTEDNSRRGWLAPREAGYGNLLAQSIALPENGVWRAQFTVQEALSDQESIEAAAKHPTPSAAAGGTYYGHPHVIYSEEAQAYKGQGTNGLSGFIILGGNQPLYTQIFYVNTNPFAEATVGTKATNSLSSADRAALIELARSPENVKKLTMYYDDLHGAVVVQGSQDTIDKVHQSFAASGVLREDKPPRLVSVSLPSGTNYSDADALSSWLVHDGKLLYELGRSSEAEAKLKEALKQDPQNQAAAYYLKLLRQDRANTLVNDAKLLYEEGRLEEAEVKLKEALKEDPQDITAIRYLKLVKEARDKTNGSLHIVSPVPQPSDPANPLFTGQRRQALIAKLNRIRLDRVSFYWQPLSEVVRFLNDEIKKRDPEERGINYLINQNIDSAGPTVTAPPKPGPDGQPTPVPPAEQVNMIAIPIKIYPALTDVRLADVLDAIVKGAKQPIKYSIEDYAIVFSERGPEKTPLYVRTFKVDTSAFLSGLRNSEPPEAIGVGQGIEVSPRIPSLSPSDGERVSPTTLTPDSPRFRISGLDLADGTAVSALVLKHLARLGVDLDPKRNPGKAVFYNDRQGVLLVRATLQDLDIVERVIAELNAAPSGGPSGTRQTNPGHSTTNAPQFSVLIQGRPIADWVKEAEISVRPGKEGERALRALENAGPPIMPQLGRLLAEDKSPEIQAKAALAMSVIGYHNPDAPEVHSAVPVLTTAAQNKSSEVRIYSVQALGAIGRAASNAVPVLIRLTRDENDGVRMSAVEALGRIGATSPESIAALTAAASDASSDVRITARKALIVVQGGKASPLMTSNEAGSLAEHLANEKAQALYNCQPFRNSPPARFVRDHWTWHRLQAQGLGDIEATVELAADGAEPKVTVVRLVSIPRTP